MTDYVALAKRLIAKNGRSVTFKQINRTATDTTKPWRGNTSNFSATTITAMAVFVDPQDMGYRTDNTDSATRAEKLALVAADVEIDDYDIIEDGSINWSIIGMRILQPGETKYLYTVELKR